MSSGTVEFSQKSCDVCGEALSEEHGPGIKVLEIPYHSIEDLRNIDSELADELERNDGRLAYHSNCTPEITQYLPEENELIISADSNDSSGNRDDQLVSCPVCNVPVLASFDQCGRCGASVDE